MGFNLLLKPLANPWIDALIRSTLSIVIFIPTVYFLKASEDINALAGYGLSWLRKRLP